MRQRADGLSTSGSTGYKLQGCCLAIPRYGTRRLFRLFAVTHVKSDEEYSIISKSCAFTTASMAHESLTEALRECQHHQVSSKRAQTEPKPGGRALYAESEDGRGTRNDLRSDLNVTKSDIPHGEYVGAK